MADLVTTIAANDAEHAAGMQRAANRMTNFAAQTKSLGRVGKDFFSGFGLGATVNMFASMVEQARQLQTELASGRDTLNQMGDAALAAGRSMRESFAGGKGQSAAGIVEQFAGQIKAIENEAAKQIEKLSNTSYKDTLVHDLFVADEFTPYLTEQVEIIRQQTASKIKAIEAERSRVVQAWKESNKQESAAARAVDERRTTEDFAASYKSVSESDEEARRFLAQMRIDGRRLAGDERGAEFARIEEERRRRFRELDAMDSLSDQQKVLAGRFIGELATLERAGVDNWASAQAAKMAGHFSAVHGGSTFAQQLAALDRSDKEAQKQSALQQQIAATLENLANAINSRSFATYN